MRFIIDADPGHDDLLAIATAHHVADIVAITTVSGNAPLSEVTANALVAADLVGFDGPVVQGAARPLRREPSYPTTVHGPTGLAGADRPRCTRTVDGTDAAGTILELSDPETWILAIGPLTNVAAAIERDPGLAGRIAGITLMGGAVDTGNVTPVAEFNIWTDPEAADIVFRSGARLVMCGLDVTTQVRYDGAWAASLDHPYLRALVEHYLRHHRYGRVGAPLHDPCAVLAVTHPQWFSFASRSVQIETRGELTRGMTVVDRRPWAGEPNVAVAGSVQADAVLEAVRRAVAEIPSRRLAEP